MVMEKRSNQWERSLNGRRHNESSWSEHHDDHNNYQRQPSSFMAMEFFERPGLSGQCEEVRNHSPVVAVHFFYATFPVNECLVDGVWWIRPVSCETLNVAWKKEGYGWDVALEDWEKINPAGRRGKVWQGLLWKVWKSNFEDATLKRLWRPSRHWDGQRVGEMREEQRKRVEWGEYENEKESADVLSKSNETKLRWIRHPSSILESSVAFTRKVIYHLLPEHHHGNLRRRKAHGYFWLGWDCTGV